MPRTGGLGSLSRHLGLACTHYRRSTKGSVSQEESDPSARLHGQTVKSKPFPAIYLKHPHFVCSQACLIPNSRGGPAKGSSRPFNVFFFTPSLSLDFQVCVLKSANDRELLQTTPLMQKNEHLKAARLKCENVHSLHRNA